MYGFVVRKQRQVKEREVRAAHTAIFGCVTVWHDKLGEKVDKKQDLKEKNWGSPYHNKPVPTRNTAERVHSVSRCVKNQNHTRTRAIRFGNTVGLPVPVPNPNHLLLYPFHCCQLSHRLLENSLMWNHNLKSHQRWYPTCDHLSPDSTWIRMQNEIPPIKIQTTLHCHLLEFPGLS